jgi:hypothetical protein
VKVVAPEELARVDPARREILYLRDLLNETIARDDGAGDAKLLDGRNRNRLFQDPIVFASDGRGSHLVGAEALSQRMRFLPICGLAQPKLISRVQYFSMPHPLNPVSGP